MTTKKLKCPLCDSRMQEREIKRINIHETNKQDIISYLEWESTGCVGHTDNILNNYDKANKIDKIINTLNKIL